MALQSPDKASLTDLFSEVESENVDFNAFELEDITQRICELDKRLRQYDWDEIIQHAETYGAGSVEGLIADDDEEVKGSSVFLTALHDIPREDSFEVSVTRTPVGRHQRHSHIVLENNIVTVASYPGFDPRQPTKLPLPEEMNAADCMLHMTRLFSFEPTMPKERWRKLFCSRLSVDIMIDTFWFFWVAEYMNVRTQARYKRRCLNLMFSRVADHYTRLFEMIPARFKDDFFKRYPNCMCQAIFYAFCQCFPQSVYTTFGDEFKHKLTTLVFNWMTGANPPFRLWDSWPKSLEPESKDFVTVVHEAAQQVMDEFEREKGLYGVPVANGKPRDLANDADRRHSRIGIPPAVESPVLKATNRVRSPASRRTRKQRHTARWLRGKSKNQTFRPFFVHEGEVAAPMEKGKSEFDNEDDDIVRVPREEFIQVLTSGRTHQRF